MDDEKVTNLPAGTEADIVKFLGMGFDTAEISVDGTIIRLEKY